MSTWSDMDTDGKKIYNLNRAICDLNRYFKEFELYHPGEPHVRKLGKAEAISLHDYFVGNDGKIKDINLFTVNRNGQDQSVETYEDLVECVYNVWDKLHNTQQVGNRTKKLVEFKDFKTFRDYYYREGVERNNIDDFLIGDITPKLNTDIYVKNENGEYEFDIAGRSLKVYGSDHVDSDNSGHHYTIENIDIFGKDSYGNLWINYDGFDIENHCINYSSSSYDSLKNRVRTMTFMRRTGLYKLREYYDEDDWKAYVKNIYSLLRESDSEFDMDFKNYVLPENVGVIDSANISQMGLMQKLQGNVGPSNGRRMVSYALVDDFAKDDGAKYNDQFVASLNGLSQMLRRCTNTSVAAFKAMNDADIEYAVEFEKGSGKTYIRYYKPNGKTDYSRLLVNSISNPFDNGMVSKIGQQEFRVTAENKNIWSKRGHGTAPKIVASPDIARAMVQHFVGDKVRLIKSKQYMSHYLDEQGNEIDFVGVKNIKTYRNAQNQSKDAHSYYVRYDAKTHQDTLVAHENLVSCCVPKLFDGTDSFDSDGYTHGMKLFIGAAENNSVSDPYTNIYITGTQQSQGDSRYGSYSYIYDSLAYKNGSKIEDGMMNDYRFYSAYDRLSHSIDYAKDILYCNVFGIFENLDLNIKNIPNTIFNEVDIQSKGYKSFDEIVSFENDYSNSTIGKLRDIFYSLYTLDQDYNEDENSEDDVDVVEESLNLANGIISSDLKNEDAADMLVKAIFPNYSPEDDRLQRIANNYLYKFSDKYLRKHPNSKYADIKNAIDLYNELQEHNGSGTKFDLEQFVNELVSIGNSEARIEKLKTIYDVFVPYIVGYVPQDLISKQKIGESQNTSYVLNNEKCYDVNGQPMFDIFVNSAVLTDLSSGVVNRDKSTTQVYKNRSVLVDDIQILQTLNPFDGKVNIVSSFISTDPKIVDSDEVVVGNKVDFKRFNEDIVTFDDTNYVPMVEHESKFINDLGVYIKDVLESRGHIVKDEDIVIDSHGIVRYKYDVLLNEYKDWSLYSKLSENENLKDFTYGYIGQIFDPLPSGAIRTNYNTVRGVTADNDTIKGDVVLLASNKAFIQPGLGSIESRMRNNDYVEMLKDRIKQKLNESCSVIENRGQLNNTILNDIYRNLYANTTPVSYEEYEKIVKPVETAAMKSKDDHGLGYDDLNTFYDDLNAGKISYNTLVDILGYVELPVKAIYTVSDNVDDKSITKYTPKALLMPFFTCQLQLNMFRLSNEYREGAGLFTILEDRSDFFVDDLQNTMLARMRENSAMYTSRDRSFIDAMFSNVAYTQGLIGAYVMGVKKNGKRLIPSDNDFGTSIIQLLPEYENAARNGVDRNNMFTQNIISGGTLMESEGLALITCGGLTMDDGYVITKDVAKANPVIVHNPETGDIEYNDDGTPKYRFMIVGDKIDKIGNKGTISRIVDPTADVKTMTDPVERWLTLFFRYNKHVGILGAPYPEISRLTESSTYESIKEFQKAVENGKMNDYALVVPDIDSVGDDKFIDKLGDFWSSLYNSDGTLKENISVDGFNRIDGLLSRVSFVLTDKNADVKSHMYGGDSDHGRSASGQLSFGLYSKECYNILNMFYAASDKGYNKVCSYLELCGMSVDDEGTFSNDISGNVSSDSKILDLMPTNENLMKLFGFRDESELNEFRTKLTQTVRAFYDFNPNPNGDRNEFERKFVNFMNNSKNTALYHEQFKSCIQTPNGIGDYAELLQRYLNVVGINDSKMYAAFNDMTEDEFKMLRSLNLNSKEEVDNLKRTNPDFAKFDFTNSSFKKFKDNFADFESFDKIRSNVKRTFGDEFIGYNRFKNNFQKLISNNDKNWFRNLTRVHAIYNNSEAIGDMHTQYTYCKNCMDLIMLNCMQNFDQYDYIQMPFDYNFKMNGSLPKGRDGKGWLFPILDKKYRSTTINGDGNLVRDAFSNQYIDLIRGLVSYEFWSLMGIDMKNIEPKNAPYIKRNYTSLSSHKGHIERICSKIENAALKKFDGKRNLMKSTLYGNMIRHSGTLVLTADPSLNLNEMSMSYDTAKTLGIIPSISDLVSTRYSSKSFVDMLKNIPDSPVKEKLLKKVNNYQSVSGRTNDFKSLRTVDKLLTAEEFKIIPDECRMCMFWRDPLLQSCGIAGFNVVLDDRLTGIAINPAMDKRFDADFDGDTIAVIGFYGKRSQQQKGLAKKAYEDVQNILSVTHTLIDYGVTDFDGDFKPYFDEVFKDVKIDELSVEQLQQHFDKVRQMEGFDLDKCKFNLNEDLDIAVGKYFLQHNEDKADLYKSVMSKYDQAKFDALCTQYLDSFEWFTHKKPEVTEKFAHRASDNLSDYTKVLLRESVGKFYMRNDTPQHHIQDLTREVIHGYKGSFSKLVNVLNFAGYQFDIESCSLSDATKSDIEDYSFVKSYITMAKVNDKVGKDDVISLSELYADFNEESFGKLVAGVKDNDIKAKWGKYLESNKTDDSIVFNKFELQALTNVASYRFDELSATATLNPLDFIQDYIKNPNNPESQFRFNNMCKHFNSIAFATNIKTMGTGVAGKYLQRGMMLARKFGPEFMDATMRITYGATQGILQAKHDPVEAVDKINMIRFYLPALYRGQHIGMREDGTWYIDEENEAPMTRREFVDSYMKVCQEATGLNFKCHEYNIEKLAHCIFESDDDNAVMKKNVYNAFKTDSYFNSDAKNYGHNARIKDQIANYSALDLAMYVEDSDKLVEFVGMSVFGEDLAWLQPNDVDFKSNTKQTVCGLLAFDSKVFTSEEIEALNSGNPIVRKYDSGKVTGYNRNMAILQKIPKDFYEIKEDDPSAITYTRFDSNGNSSVTMGKLISVDDKTGDALVCWSDMDVTDELKKVSKLLYDDDQQYKSNYDGLCSRALFDHDRIEKQSSSFGFLSDVDFGMRFCGKKDEDILMAPQVYYQSNPKNDPDKTKGFALSIKRTKIKDFTMRNDLIINQEHKIPCGRFVKTFGVYQAGGQYHNQYDLNSEKTDDALLIKTLSSGNATESVVVQEFDSDTRKMVTKVKEDSMITVVNDPNFGMIPKCVADMYNQQYDLFTDLCKQGQYKYTATKEDDIIIKDEVVENSNVDSLNAKYIPHNKSQVDVNELTAKCGMVVQQMDNVEKDDITSKSIDEPNGSDD